MQRVAAITGGSGGIGAAAAHMLSEKGWRVFELSRSGKDRTGICHIDCDVTSDEAVLAAFADIERQAKRLDVLINNAGMGISGAVEFTEMTDAKAIFDVNFFGTLRCTKAALPMLRKSGGTIVNLSSVAAPVAIPFQALYSATKSAVSSLTLALRSELRPLGVRVCAVLPGDVRTGFTDARRKSIQGNEVYGDAIERAVSAMEKDERTGMAPEKAARVICAAAEARRPRALYTVGGAYKLAVLAAKLLPATLSSFIVGKIYG